MRRLLIACCALAFVFSACQKEVRSDSTTTNSTTGNGTRLVRIGTRTGADSITTNLTYNNANAITSLIYLGTLNGQPITAELYITRNANNIITSYVAKSNVYGTLGIDSVITTCLYDAAASRYKNVVGKYKVSGVANADSTVFSYDASGKLIADMAYHNDGTGYFIDSKDSIFYTGNNIASVKTYVYNGGSFDLTKGTSYDQYDSNMNPLQFKTDAPVLGMTTFYSANNVTKRRMTDYTSSSSTSAVFTYTYNNNNRPTKAVSTDGTNFSISTYYYQ